MRPVNHMFFKCLWFRFKGQLMSPMFSFSETSARGEFLASFWLARYCFVLFRHTPRDRRANESAAREELLLHMLKQSGFLNNRTTALVRMFHVTETSVCARPAVPFPALSWLIPRYSLEFSSSWVILCDLSAVRTCLPTVVWPHRPPLLFVGQMLSQHAPARKQTTAWVLQIW